MRQFVGAWIIALWLAMAQVLAAPVNESGIRVRKAVASDQVNISGAQVCQGTVPSDVNLRNIALSPSDLKRGVACIAEDFDRNGSLDFMLYGAYIKSESRRYSLVILYAGSAVIKTQLIPGALELFKSTDPERKNYPKYKNATGLIKHAEGDRGIVYFFDSKAGSFKKAPYVYPSGYEMGD